ncbi:urea ABC transporter permease subunit UrtB [Kaarinaea lacus]
MNLISHLSKIHLRQAFIALNIVSVYLLVFFSPVAVSADEPENNEEPITFESAVNALAEKSFKKKTKAVNDLIQFKDKRVLKVLSTMLEGDLYYRKSDKRVVATKESDDGYKITDIINNEELGVLEKRKIKKISTNNKLRKILRTEIARLSLGDEDSTVRLNAVNEIAKDIDADSADLLRETLEKETNTSVKDAIQIALALIDIDSLEKGTRINAIKTLGESLNPEARNRLAVLLKKDEQGAYLEPDSDIRKAAGSALTKYDDSIAFYEFIETAFFGLSLGSVLLLIAIGLAITFGVMGVINMAHGELMMIGAYTTYLVQLAMPNNLDISVLVAIPAAFIIAGLFGIAIERGVIRHLYGRPLETLLATFGISLILQQMVRTGISAQNVVVTNPSWMSGSLDINAALSITYNRIYIFIFAIIVFIGLLLILKKTALGLHVRAVSQNRTMAKAMGIKTEWVDALTFGLGSGVAGVAGVALSQLTNVGPNMGQGYIIDSFMVVVFGGVGNLWGTIVGALSLGVANKFLEPWAGAVLAKILVLVFIILFIQKRPRGLFPQKGRAAEN